MLGQWKTGLKALGFVYKNNMFMYGESASRPLQFGVSIQKNVRGETYKVNPSILLKNPLPAGSDVELLLLANLRRDGIYLHVERSSWWAKDALPEALECLKEYGLPWFQKVGRADYLAEVMEKAIREKQGIMDVIEPLDESLTALPWAESSPRRAGPAMFYQSAVLHYLNGDREKSVERTEDWLNSLSATDSAGRARARAQLERIKQEC